MVVFGHKWLYSDKSGCILVKVVVIGQGSRIRAKLLYWGKTGCIRYLQFGKNCIRQCGCIRAKEVVFEQSGCIRTKVIVFGKSGFIRAKWLYLGKSSCIRAK